MWEMKFRGMGDRKRLSREQPIQQQCYACDEMAYKFFVNDLENPYTTPPDKPFSWIRGRQVGGRSIMWGRQVYRWSDLDFEANAREGIGVDWPIRYAESAPCHYCGPCHRGCITRSYFSSVNATLPAAQATGRLTLRPYSVVHSITYDKKTGRATGVRVIDGQTKHAIEFKARIVFLCASTIESARILLLSGIANSSGQVG